MIALKNILVPTDYGEASALALEYGRHLARQFGARLHVLHVVGNVVALTGAELPVAAVAEVEVDRGVVPGDAHVHRCFVAVDDDPTAVRHAPRRSPARRRTSRRAGWRRGRRPACSPRWR